MKRIIYNYRYEDTEFGTVYIVNKQNVSHIIFKIVDGSLVVTTPLFYNETITKPYVDRMRSKILTLFDKYRKTCNTHFINEQFCIESDIFCFHIVCDMSSGYRLNTTPHYNNMTGNPSEQTGVLPERYDVVLHCPQDIDFCDEKKQRWLESVVVGALQDYAELFLPPILAQMAKDSGLSVEYIAVGHAQTRWGTCRRSARKEKCSRIVRPDTAKVDVGAPSKEEYYPHKIMLSAYTALLPTHLMKYIMLHELAHTRHPNHSAEFHNTVNQLTTALLGLKESQCEKQMHSFHTNIFCFAKMG